MPAQKVLIIDDEPTIRYMVARILERAGYSTVAAANGAQGYACFCRERPSIVITDLIMPVREGIETIHRIRREGADLPIIAMSGSTSNRKGGVDFLSMARELGATEILRKPFEPAELLDTVQRCLAAPNLADRV
ncbi:MAG TPA: response regulator [Stellaceae bacterium]|nr:response regulator [Stellaceae bacterium]